MTASCRECDLGDDEMQVREVLGWLVGWLVGLLKEIRDGVQLMRPFIVTDYCAM